MEFVRTPEARFVALPDFAFAPHYCEIDSGIDGSMLRMHYLDEGERDARVLLCLHGEPTWSYLYRKMIPRLCAAGYRCIAPDLIGFGRSDKPVAREAYSYERHVAWLADFFDRLALDAVVLVAQDWGGLLGLRLVADRPERFAGLVLANTFLPTGDEPVSEGFLKWRASSQRLPEPFPAGRVLARTCTPPLDDETAFAYDAPFPDERYAAGARVFPLLVPTSPDDRSSEPTRAAWGVLETFEKPVLCAFSDGDPITRGSDALFRDRIPGARYVAPVTIAGASHFLQEDRPNEFADAIARFVRGYVDKRTQTVELVAACDADFAWLLGEGDARDGLRLAPGNVADAATIGHVRSITQTFAHARPGSWMIVVGAEVVGLCGFHGPATSGEITIGYNVAQSRSNRGYATTAVGQIVALVADDAAVRAVVAETVEANLASQRVLSANGFERGETRDDPDEGRVVRWSRSTR